jgi:asparagine synthase (glutamine-hydrolysing)
MCGISGKLYFNKNKTILREEIERMCSAISHRGPDDEGVFINKNIGLGHRRLSIIDLSPAGHQPMSDNEGKVWIVHNGEIYNFLELRKNLEKDGVQFKSKSDTEVIIYLYKKYGVDCLKYLRGMFAFAIWDSEKKQLFLARDRLGKKPLKYYQDGNCFIFASELKAILKNPEVKKEIDYEAVDEYLAYQYVPCPKTGFKNIYKLEPAHYLIVKETGEIIKKKYWNLDFSQKLNHSEEEWEKIVLNKLKESVKFRLVSDVPLGAHLSGGIDSSLIVALMAEELNKPVKTYSIGFKESDYNELPYARLMAERYKTDHHEFIIESNAIEDILPKLVYQYEEPYADSSALPTWYLSEITKQHVTVALNGDGGDENFAGYNRYIAMKLLRQIRNLPFKNLLKKISLIAYQSTKIKSFHKGYRLFKSCSNSTIDSYLNIIVNFGPEEKEKIYTLELKENVNNSRWYFFLEEKFKQAQGLEWLDQLLLVGIQSHLPDDLLVKVDIASMAHALEIRSPFLDHELLELTAKMPSSLKMRGYNKKYLLKKIAYKYLPKECIDRPKQGFSLPLEHWFRVKLNDYLKAQLLDKKFLDYGFKKDGIKKLIQDHKNHRQDYTNQLWTLLTLKNWLEIFNL